MLQVQEAPLLSDTQICDDLPLTALQEAWRYYIQEDHLPSWKQEAAKDLLLLFVSAGSVLYGIIANRYAADRPEWERQLFIYGTSFPAAAVLINATNEYLFRRNARRFPEKLKQYYLPISKLSFFIEDLFVGLISAVASISFATAAWRYSDAWEKPPLQIVWTIYIELVNTALHLLPVELVIFNHPVFSLPIRPFKMGFQWLYRLSLTPEEKAHNDFLAFKCRKSNEIAEIFKGNLDQLVRKILQGSFQWNGFSGGIKKWFSFIAKPEAILNDLSDISIKDMMEKASFSPLMPPESKQSSWMNWTGRQFKNLGYSIGAAWLLSSCAGFLADPFSALLDSDMNKNAALSISSLASYFLGVLLGHMGGSSLQTDLAKVYNILRGQGEIPLHAKLHTKSFGLWFFVSVLLARYSYAMSVELIEDHFSDFSFFNALKAVSISGVTYMSFFAMQKLFEDYLIKLVSLNSREENHLIAVLQRKIEDFKRHIPSDPDQLLSFFKHCSEEDLQFMLGMSKSKFLAMTDFESLYAEDQRKQSCALKISECGQWMLCRSKKRFPERQALILNDNPPSFMSSSSMSSSASS